MSFELLKARFAAYQENEKRKHADFIRNGWNNDPDSGLRRYSTDTRFYQYKHGEITREQAIEYAIKRMEKATDKETKAKFEYLDMVAAAPDIDYIRIEVEWRRSSVWGNNPSVEVSTNGFGRTTGYASGCGYDKESAAVASALNDNGGIMKILYTLKENALKAGADDYNKSIITKVDNRSVLGYGAGYSVIPYFEGGVGVSCFWAILKKAGFEVRGEHGKTWDLYRLEKVNK